METIQSETGEPHSLHRGGIYNYFQGATINNFVYQGTIKQSGPVYLGQSAKEKELPHYSERKISQSISVLNGKEKLLNEKQLFFGIIKVLQSRCGWSPNVSECCRKINELPGADNWEIACDENNLKAPRALRFANRRYEEWRDYDPLPAEKVIFWKTKTAADSFLELLEASASE